uniref:uncharacterized protein n=1 Tax=Pristiophorus japonicus TaxID=55135 RepID=UPI00398F8428
MAEVEEEKEMTSQGSEERPVEISKVEREDQDAPNEEAAGELTIEEETFEKNEATETMMHGERQQEAGSAEMTGEGQAAEGAEGPQLGGKEELDLQTRNENEESDQGISTETAKELEEGLLEAVDSTAAGLQAGQSDRNPNAEDLSNENKNESVEGDQNQESGGKGCQEEAEEVAAMKDIGHCAALEGTIGERVGPQPQHVVDEERTEGSVSAEETQTGSEADAPVDVAAEPDFKEDSDNTTETANGVSSGDKPEQCGTEAECLAGQVELSAHTVGDHGSMTAVAIARRSNDQSSDGDALPKQAKRVGEDHVCRGQEPPADVETGPEAMAETADAGLQTSAENAESHLEIQPRGVEQILPTSAKGCDDSPDIPPVPALPCFGKGLEISEENQHGRAADRTAEIPVGTAGPRTEAPATEDVDEQPATTDDAGRGQDAQAAEATHGTEEQESNRDNLTESVPATGSPATVLGEGAKASLEQLRETEILESEGEDVPGATAPGDDGITVAGEQ